MTSGYFYEGMYVRIDIKKFNSYKKKVLTKDKVYKTGIQLTVEAVHSDHGGWIDLIYQLETAKGYLQSDPIKSIRFTSEEWTDLINIGAIELVDLSEKESPEEFGKESCDIIKSSYGKRQERNDIVFCCKET